MTIGHGGDQRFASARPDVLVYETEPLTSDVILAARFRPAPVRLDHRQPIPIGS